MASAGQDGPIHPVLDFAAGTVGGMVGLVVGFPFDTIKVRLQHPETMSRYRNSVQALFKIVREERVAGLFKGISSPMAACATLNGLVFASTGYLIQAQLPDASTKPTLTQITIAGAGTGIIGAFIATPTELIKIRQQANTSSGKQPSAWSVARALYQGHGVRGLYRGFWTTAGRDMSYGTYFATYEGMRRLLTVREPDGKEKPLSWARLMVAGGVAGISGWVFTFHLDSIKTRVQSVDFAPPRHHPLPGLAPPPALGPSFALARAYSNSAPAVSPYKTTWSTTMHMYRTEGLRSFWKGLWPTIIRAVPVNMATFGAYELVVGLAR